MLHKEKVIRCHSGWGMVLAAIALFVAMVAMFVQFIRSAIAQERGLGEINFWFLVGAVCSLLAFIAVCKGFFFNQPNVARVITLLGYYVGTVKANGFFWANPFTQRERISLRSRNLLCDQLKVNDKRGNPIEIAAVVTWHVEDTAQAAFDIENYQDFIRTQSETALRHLANEFAYDRAEDEAGLCLRDSVDEVSSVLRKELQERVRQAGITVEDCRITHLAYAPEIAGAMLRRQQAEAIIDARQKIVHGAVSMVQMALRELAEKDIVHLDEERKAQMVGNLLLILCGETEAQPVINAGTLYP